MPSTHLSPKNWVLGALALCRKNENQSDFYVTPVSVSVSVKYVCHVSGLNRQIEPPHLQFSIQFSI
jgi:hypothetical protein